MVAANQRFVTPRDVARILFRHWRKMAAFFCAVIALTFVVIALYPRSYSSEAKLLIRIGRESVALDPTATTGETIMLQKTQTDEVNSALSIIGEPNGARTRCRSKLAPNGFSKICRVAFRDGCSQAVDRCDSSIANGQFGLNSVLRALHLSDPGTELDMAVRSLQGGVTSLGTQGIDGYFGNLLRRLAGVGARRCRRRHQRIPRRACSAQSVGRFVRVLLRSGRTACTKN